MNSIDSFDEIFTYKLFNFEKKAEDLSKFLLFGVLVDGVDDFNQFSHQIKKILHPNSKIIQIYNNLSFISFSANYNHLIKIIKQITQLSHFNVYSIFLKKHKQI